MPRPDRFNPTIFERLKQSKAARLKNRGKEPPPPTEETWRVPEELNGSTMAIITNGTNTGRLRSVQMTAMQRLRMFDTETTVWGCWNDACTTGATTTYDPWNTWVSNTTPVTFTVNDWQFPRQNVPRTRQQIAQDKAAREAAEQRFKVQRDADRARYEAAERARHAALKRAKDLLLSVLHPQQAKDLLKGGFFYVNAPSGRLYRIDEGTHGNLKVISRETGKIVERLCIQPDGVPAGDAMLVQKLMIETAEEALRAHANITVELDGKIIWGDKTLLDNAKVIPFLRRAA